MKTDWRKVILYLTVIGMEGCWLYALTLLLNRQAAGGLLSVPGVLLVYPLAFVFNLLLYRLRWSKFILTSISWLIWAAGMLVTVKVQLAGNLAWSDTAWLMMVPRSIADVIYTFKPELLVLLLTAVLWWLGRRLSRSNITFGTAVSEFQFGLVMLVLVFFIASQFDTGMGNPVPLALSFFLFALVGISVAHAMEGANWLAGIYKGHWSGILLLSIGVVFALGLVISAIITPDVLDTIWTAIKWVWSFIWGIILKIIAFLVNLFPGSEPSMEELPPMPGLSPVPTEEETARWVMPEWLRSGLRLAWIITMIAFAVFAIWRISSDIFRWLRRRQAGRGGAEYEPLRGAFRTDLLNLLKRFISGIKRLFRPGVKNSQARAEIANVIQVYRQFLRWAASIGHSRHVSQTPYEFGSGLAELMPEAVTDINLVTREYVKARYGAWVSSPDELNNLTRAWYKIKQTYPKKRNTGRTRKKEES